MKMPFNKLVSIIIPCYNAEAYISRCIDSVLAQTYSEIEINIINDGSTDNTLKIVESYRANDNRIMVVSKENGGLSSARNKGVEVSNGEYIFFLDADDFIAGNTIERLLIFAETHDLDMAEGKTVYYYDENTLSDYTDIKYGNDGSVIIKGQLEIYRFYLLEFKKINAWNKLIKRCVLVENDIQFVDGLISEDVLWLYIHLLSIVKNIGFISDITYYYYKGNEKSITQSYSENHIISYLYIVKELLNNNIIYDLLVNMNNTICNEYIFNAVKQYSILYANNDYGNKYLSEIREILCGHRYLYLSGINKKRFIIKVVFCTVRYKNFIFLLFINLLKLYLRIRYKLK